MLKAPEMSMGQQDSYLEKRRKRSCTPAVLPIYSLTIMNKTHYHGS